VKGICKMKRFAKLLLICTLAYQIPYWAGYFFPKIWILETMPLFMFWGGMFYESYYDNRYSMNKGN